MSAHAVQFYEHDAFLIDSVAEFVGDGLAAGDGVVVIATEPHLAELGKRLGSLGVGFDAARGEDRYLALDARTTLHAFARAGCLDRDGFSRVIGGALDRVTRSSRREVRAFGEMVALLWAQQQPELALELESLWNELARTRRLQMRCAYPLAAFDDEASAKALRAVCDQHDAVIPAESFTALRREGQRGPAIAELQRKGRAFEIEIAQRRQVVRELSEKNRTLRALIEASPVPIVMIDLDATVRSWNPAAERVFGWTEAEVLGRAIPIVPPDKLAECVCVRAGAARGESFLGVATHRLRRDGSTVEVQVSASPVRDDDGLPEAVVLVFEDVTARNRAEAERLKALHDAEAANRAKDEFLAMLGHELRNPLSSLRNAVLTAAFDPGRREPAMQIARRGVDQLVRLVDDLLDVARITQGRIPLRRERIAIRDVVESALETTRTVVEDRAQTLLASLPERSLQVDGDAARLEQVIVNLVTNAAKYGKAGGRIEVEAHHERGEAVVRVSDDGIGIAPDMLPRIFDLFAQAERALDRPEGGLGIGLTVVRRLVELHGGRIEAQSDGPGRGARFEVRLPAVIDASVRSAAEAVEDAVSSTGARILVVEDNLDAAESLAMLLGVFGHRSRVVHDGARALEIAQLERFDLVLMDIGLPGMDGYEVVERMRALPCLRDLRIAALTGYGRDEDRQRALAAGFDLHLVKPVDPRALKELLASLAPRSDPSANRKRGVESAAQSGRAPNR